MKSPSLKATYLKRSFRQNELKKLEKLLSLGANVFVYGPSGSGKTLLVKKALEKFPQPSTFYLDCSLYQTLNAILRESEPLEETLGA